MIARVSLSLFALAVAAVPASAHAAKLQDVVATIGQLLDSFIPIFITLAILAFFWGLILYLSEAAEKKTEGIQIMFYGLLALFVMVSIWGIIGLLRSTFNVTDNRGIRPTQVPLR